MKAAGPGTNRKGHMRPAHQPAASFLPSSLHKGQITLPAADADVAPGIGSHGKGEATQREKGCVCGERRALNLSVAMSGLATESECDQPTHRNLV